MNLADYQRTVLRVCLAPTPAAADLAALGGSPVWTEVYREMVRRRLRNMAKNAYARTLAQVGEEAFAACVSRFLAERPPASGLIREVIASFGGFARRDRALLARATAHVADLLVFEQAKWETGYVRVSMPEVGRDGVREFDFQGIAVLNPSLRVLRFAYPVHQEGGGDAPAPRSTALWMYRPPGVDEVRWFEVPPFAARLSERWQRGEGCVADTIRSTADELERPVDASLLEELSDVLTLGVQRGVIVGVR